MTTEKVIWNRVTKFLESKLPRPEFEIWFSQTTLNKLEGNSAVIGVPNKFIANWLRDNYLHEIVNSFKVVLKETPEIDIIDNYQSAKQIPTRSQKTGKSDRYFINNIDPSMDFSRFIRGESNRFALSSALDVASRPARHYNPLYIYSKLSLGKTHLLNAIGNHVLSKDPSKRVVYTSSQALISDFNYSLKNRSLYEFKNKYTNLDILLFDDIQTLANRKRVQEEFLSIFDALYGENRQIVITGDRPPNVLKKIDLHIISRLEWGLLTEIQALDTKTKIDIIKRKVKEDGVNIPNDIISFLAKSHNDIKMLIKNIIKLKIYTSIYNRDINISIVKSLIRSRYNNEIGVKDILSITSNYFNISISDLLSTKKKRAYSYPRHLAMYLCRKYTNLSFKEIGSQFGDRDHSTVLYASKQIERSKTQRKEVKEDINNIENLIG